VFARLQVCVHHAMAEGGGGVEPLLTRLL
jgi:hypothetical protein